MKVTCGLIIENEKILAVKRGKEKSHAGKWEFPGGKVKKGESFKGCLKRELEEELNIRVDIISPCDIVLHTYPKFDIELIPFICEIIDGDILLMEHSDMKWCNMTEIEKLDFSDADQIIIEQIKKAGGIPALGNSDKK